jgi:hypothetical protein
MRPVIRAALLITAFVGCATDAFSQDRQSHWGVSASFVPYWFFPEPLADAWDMDTDMSGMEMRVGIVRGSDLGGDVGVSFVKKRVSDDSRVFVQQTGCVDGPSGTPACARGAYHVTQGAGMTGVEGHVYLPFGTIRNRVQIGGVFAGGIARFDGETDRFLEHLVIAGNNITVTTDPLGRGPFKEALPDIPQDWTVVPIGRAELALAVIVRPGLKLRFTGGVNFPGFNVFGVNVQYLFGAR